MNYLVQNRIKQSEQCCVNCGRGFKKRENLSKHLVLCDLLQISKKKSVGNIDEEELEIPSQRIMFQMLVELGCKYNKLEEQMSEMTKWVSKKKKKINVVEWLNTNIMPHTDFDCFVNGPTIVITKEDAEFIMGNSFNDVLYQIFSKCLFGMEMIPIFAFDQKVNTFYVFKGENNGWIELSRENLTKWFNKIHMKLVDVFYSLKKANNTESGTANKEQFETAWDKTLVKLMNIDFRVESIFSKARSVLFQGLKTDIKALVEYEFEFNT